MSKTLIERFESVLAHRMLRLGANVERFAESDGFDDFRFRYGGMPSEWRTNLRMALDSLSELERQRGGNDEIEGIREVIYSIWNAMRRSDQATLKRVLRHAVGHWRVPTSDVLPPPAEHDHVEQIAAKAADAYRNGGT